MNSARPARAPSEPRTVFAAGSAIGYVEPGRAGFVAKLPSGEQIGLFAVEREAVYAIHDRTRKDRIARAMA